MQKKCLAWILTAAFTMVLSFPMAGLAAGTSDPADGAGIPVSAETVDTVSSDAQPSITITLADLCTVAKYISGQGTLTETQMEEFDLTGNGDIDLADLQMLVAIFTSQRAPEPEPEPDPAQEPDPATATVAITGTISSVDAEDSTWYINEDREDAVDETGAVISDETLLVDYETGSQLQPDSLTAGTRVQAFLSLQQMPSLPPKSPCYALIANIPGEGTGNATYVDATEVAEGENGSIRVLNQNRDLWVTLPSGMELDILGNSDEKLPAAEITLGTKMVVWFDSIEETSPAQTTAVRAVVMQSEPEVSPVDPDPEHGTVLVYGTVTTVDEENDTWYIREDREDAVDEIGAIITDTTAIVDYETGQAVPKSELRPGTHVTAYLGMTQMPSLPPRSECCAVIVNQPDPEEGSAVYVYATEVTDGSDNSVVVLNQNRDMLITIPANMELGVVGAPGEKASPADIEVGTRLIAWYDVMTLSYPGQALATRAAIIPDVPAAEADQETVTLHGTVASVDEQDGRVLIRPDGMEISDELAAIVSSDTILIDAATGETRELTTLSEGTPVTAFLGMEQMPSIPPQAACAAIIVETAEDTETMTTYVEVSEVSTSNSGAVLILNQNKDLQISIPADVEIEVIGQPGQTIAMDQITDNSRLIVWYSHLQETYPAQTTAVRVMAANTQA